MASCGTAGKKWNESQLRKYPFPTEPLERVEFGDPKIAEYVAAEVRMHKLHCHPKIFAQSFA